MMSWLFLTDSKLSTDTQSSLTVTTLEPTAPCVCGVVENDGRFHSS